MAALANGYIELSIPAGEHHFDGHQALAYARTRHQDYDYHRMERQQLTFLALRRQINPCSLIPRFPELLDMGRDSLWTDLPIDQLPDLLSLAQRVDTKHIKRGAFNPPEIPEYLDAAAVAKGPQDGRRRLQVGQWSFADTDSQPVVGGLLTI